MTLREVREQIRVRRLPPKELACARARRRVVELCDHADKAAEELCCLFGRNALRRDAEPTTDRLGDRAEWNSLFGRRMDVRARSARFHRKAIEARSVERVHGRPAGRTVTDIGGEAVLARR